jgi:hypothetical protein
MKGTFENSATSPDRSLKATQLTGTTSGGASSQSNIIIDLLLFG